MCPSKVFIPKAVFRQAESQAPLPVRQDPAPCAQEKLQFLLGNGQRQRVAKIVLVTMVLGGIIAAFFAFSDDVVLECDRILMTLHDHQFAPSPAQVNSQR